MQFLQQKFHRPLSANRTIQTNPLQYYNVGPLLLGLASCVPHGMENVRG